MLFALLIAFTTVRHRQESRMQRISYSPEYETALLILSHHVGRLYRKRGPTRISNSRQLPANVRHVEEPFCRFTTETCSSISRPTSLFIMVLFNTQLNREDALVKFLGKSAKSLNKERSSTFYLKSYKIEILLTLRETSESESFGIIICSN